MEKTEKKFKEWCNKNSFFCKKFLTHTSQGNGGKQESDFLFCSNEKVYLVECKERHGDLFAFDDLTQEKKLLNVVKKTNLLNPYILLNFIEHKTIILLTLDKYFKLKENSKFNSGKQRKSINIKDISLEYKFTWKNLKFK